MWLRFQNSRRRGKRNTRRGVEAEPGARSRVVVYVEVEAEVEVAFEFVVDPGSGLGVGRKGLEERGRVIR